jgi:hypothetical protein
MDWKSLVGSIAPVLGTALGGPFGGMAGKFIAEKLGVDEKDLPDVLEGADSETLLKIRNSDNEFKLRLRELGIQEEQLHSQDRASARDLAVKTSLMPQSIIATVFIVGFIAVLYTVFTQTMEFTTDQAMLANVLLGILSAGVMQIMNFFFGSSSGSKEKTQLIGKKLYPVVILIYQ